MNGKNNLVKNLKKFWLLIIILATILIGGGTYAWQKSTQSTDTVTTWKTYQNKKLGFELQIPSYISIIEDSRDLIIFESEKENFELRLRDKEYKSQNLNHYSYLDLPIFSKSTLGEKEAVIFKAPNGYCDGPGCTKPFIAYSAMSNETFYNLVFKGDTSLNDTEEAILISFKFIQ